MDKKTYYPSLDEFRHKARDFNIIPVYRSVLADTDTPVSAFLKIDGGGDAFLLESVEGGEKWGRYSFLGSSGRMSVKARGTDIEVTEGGGTRAWKGDPIEAMRGIMAGFRAADVEGAPRFCGGAIGYMSYDMVRHVERLPDTSRRDLDLPDMQFLFTDAFLAFDNVEHRIKAVANAYVPDGADAAKVYGEAVERIDALVEKLRARSLPERRAGGRGGTAPVESNFDRADFLGAVERTKRYITEGDVIQTVLSQRFSTSQDVDPFDVYRALRVINPSPYLFFLRLGGLTLAGSSPEILVRAEDGTVNVKPIAGTRRRGRDEEEDRGLEAELLADPKERAEHIMLVDLGRNDVGRVSRAGTVTVDELMTVERYSHVMHIVSNVTGRLMPGLDAFDAFKACFPAGTLTGAPKVRAMEIIEELEPVKRGVYGGSVGYFGYGGNMDMCIAIRTVVADGKRFHVQAGAGVVADSVPEKEFEETENKARAMLKAIEMARGGLF